MEKLDIASFLVGSNKSLASQSIYIYYDLGQILECGFNLTSKNFTFLLETACVASYRTEYASVKDFNAIYDQVSCSLFNYT